MAQKQGVVGGAGPFHRFLHGNPSSPVSPRGNVICFTHTALQTWDTSFLIPPWLLIGYSLFPPLFIMLLEALVWSLAHFVLAPPCSDLLTNRFDFICIKQPISLASNHIICVILYMAFIIEIMAKNSFIIRKVKV